jgi:hypothetical protein
LAASDKQAFVPLSDTAGGSRLPLNPTVRVGGELMSDEVIDSSARDSIAG